MEQDKFFGGPFALRILYPHEARLLYRTGTLKSSECQGVRLANGVLYGRRRTGVKGGRAGERQDTHVAPVLPERASSEGPRSTAAIGATWVPCLDEIKIVQKEGEEKGKQPGCPLCSQDAHDERGRNDTRADPLLPERARSECARSTAAVGPTRVPFHARRSERAWKDH